MHKRKAKRTLPMKYENITIREVARLAKVSASTVSMVINGNERVSPETRRIVEQIILKTGYTPGRPGRRPLSEGVGPRSSRTSRVALLNPSIERAALNSPVYMDVLHGVEEAVYDAGFTLVVRHLPQHPQRIGALFPQRVDGVILFGSPVRAAVIEALSSTPCVQIMGKVTEDETWDHLSYDNKAVGRLAAEYMMERGHKHVAMIGESSRGGAVNAERFEMFRQTWKATCGEEGIRESKQELVIKDTNSQRVNQEALRCELDRLLGGGAVPTGMFLMADLFAGPVYNDLLRRGLQPGRDMDILSCNNERLFLDPLHPRPATIDIHAETIGRQGAMHLLWRLANPNAARQDILLAPQLIPGN